LIVNCNLLRVLNSFRLLKVLIGFVNPADNVAEKLPTVEVEKQIALLAHVAFNQFAEVLR